MPLSLQILPKEYVDLIDSAAEKGLSGDEMHAWKRIITSIPFEGLSQIKDFIDTAGHNGAALLRSFVHELSLLEEGNETEAMKLIDEQIALLSR